jgi:mono/diheme cytochrome c family protein
VNGDKLKKIYVAALAIFVLVIVSACGDNSIDTRVDPAAPVIVTFPIELTDERVASGEQIYSENCASCHGPVNGPVVLDSAPVHGDAGHTWHHPDRLLFEWILDRPPLAATMPAFRGTLSDEEVADAMAYIKSHWLPEILERQSAGSAQYEDQIIEPG